MGYPSYNLLITLLTKSHEPLSEVIISIVGIVTLQSFPDLVFGKDVSRFCRNLGREYPGRYILV